MLIVCSEKLEKLYHRELLVWFHYHNAGLFAGSPSFDYTLAHQMGNSMIHIVTDTLAGIPAAISSQLNLTVIPQYIIIDNRAYRDDFEITPNEIVTTMKNDGHLPHTAAPPPSLYHPVFAEKTANGDIVLVIGPSAVLSGTVNSVKTAMKEFPDADIRVFDTGIIAAPMATMAIQAARWAKEGKSIDKIIASLEDMKRRFRAYLVLNSLEYLHKGGRIGGAQAVMGSLLQVKPILTMGQHRIEPYQRVRSHRKALERLVSLTEAECPPDENSHLCIMQCDAEQDAVWLSETLSRKLSLSPIPVYGVSSALIVHRGTWNSGGKFLHFLKILRIGITYP